MKISAKNNFRPDKFHQQFKTDPSPAKESTSISPKRIDNSTDVGTIKPQGSSNLTRILRSIIWPAFMFFLVATLDVRIKGFGVLAKPTTPAERKYEEYYIEHEISSTQAKNSVMTYNSNSLSPPPGCQKCTEEELIYCGSSLMNDHCCCDKEYFEKLPFIPHTCYLGTQPCTPITDCATYARLRDCCCNNLLIKKWRAKNGAKLPEAIFSLQLLIVAVFVNILRLVVDF